VMRLAKASLMRVWIGGMAIHSISMFRGALRGAPARRTS
jgi:hypothetical protein